MVKNENVLVTAIEDFMALQSWEQKELGNQFGIIVIEIVNNTREGIVMFIQAKKGTRLMGSKKNQMLK